MTTSPHWLDILPAIPLARGVPVVQRIGQGIATGIAIQADVIRWDGDLGRRHGSVGRAHVDLDDPQGMGWALRFVGARGHHVDHWMPEAEYLHFVGGWIHGTTTDADRVALARALAEVTA